MIVAGTDADADADGADTEDSKTVDAGNKRTREVWAKGTGYGSGQKVKNKDASAIMRIKLARGSAYG